MNVVVISASMRAKSQSLKIANWLSTHAATISLDAAILDLHALDLPMFTASKQRFPAIETLRSQLGGADAVVFVSPEWNGMMSHGLMNMMHFLGLELANKPVMLVGVSSGRNGHYPLLQMRTIGYKNTHLVVSPEGLLIQDCKEVFNDHDMSPSAPDSSVKARADYSLRVLEQYAIALRQVRESGVIDGDRFDKGV